MAKRLLTFILVINTIFLAACATLSQHQKNDLLAIEKLLAQLPSENVLESELIFRAILEHGEGGILKICKLLDTQDSTTLAGAEYALNGLANYVSAPAKEDINEFFLDGLHKALAWNTPYKQKTFLINQLQICGNDESIISLSNFLTDDKLCEAAVQAIVAINSSNAGTHLLSALPEASNKNKITLINALGELKYESGAEKLLNYINDNNIQVSEAAYFALSNTGYLPALSKLKIHAQENPEFEYLYLNFAAQLAARGEINQCQEICQDVLVNAQGKFTQSARRAALSLLVEVSGDKAQYQLFKALAEDDEKMQMGALNSAQSIINASTIQKWIEFALKSPPKMQLKIIKMLQNKNDANVIAFFRQSLKAESSEVRQMAIVALLKSLENGALPDLISELKKPIEENDKKEYKQNLSAFIDSSGLSIIMHEFAGFSISSKMLLIDLLVERENSSYNPALIKQLNSDNEQLRKSVLKGLIKMGNDNDLNSLTTFLLQTENLAEQKLSQRAISAILKRSQNKDQTRKIISEIYQEAPSADKVILHAIFKSVASSDYLEIVKMDATDSDNHLQESAMRALFNWSDQNALETLIEIATTNNNQEYRILAIRGALRILRENPINEASAYGFYNDLMEAAERPQEKRQILAGLAKVETPSSLKLILKQLDDEQINFDAFLSALQIAEIDDSENENLQPQEVTQILINSYADSKLSDKIDSFKIENQIHNIPPQGFTSLFNGIDLSGWKGLVGNPITRAKMSSQELSEAQSKADAIMQEHWKVVDGTLYFIGKGFHNICTTMDFGDFELLLDWKIEKEGDKSLYLRGVPQVQIWGADKWKIGSGGLFNNQKNLSQPLAIADKPIGEWNNFRIIMKGERVTVYLNDVLIVDNEVLENYWERDKALYSSVQIELHAHESPLVFRNIFIREFDAVETAFSGKLFNGKDLSDWQVINNEQESWKVENGILYTDGQGGGWLSTDKEFENFKLELEFRLPEAGNSGVFLRTPREGDPAYVGLEIQVLDDYAEKYKNLKEWQYTGSIYGLQSPSKQVTKKSAEWQKMEIECNGPSVKVFLNDNLIIDANLIDFMDQEKIHPGIKRRKGYIGLQNHSTRIEYKNLYLTELK